MQRNLRHIWGGAWRITVPSPSAIWRACPPCPPRDLRHCMGCSDVSEFEHIYGQIFTTPSCVYDRLFTWTVMVDFNALIVWKTLLDICLSVKSSLLALTAAYIRNSEEWFGWWYEAVAAGHVPRCVQYCYLIETPGDFTVKKLKTYNFVISGWVKPLQVLERLFRQQF